MIRLATEQDIPVLVSEDIGGGFYKKSQYNGIISYEPEMFAAYFRIIMSCPDSIVLVSEREGDIEGFMMGSLIMLPFSSTRVAAETFLYVKKPSGLAPVTMITRFEQWAKDKGASAKLLGVSTGLNLEKTNALLGHLGYHHVGGNYFKKG